MDPVTELPSFTSAKCRSALYLLLLFSRSTVSDSVTPSAAAHQASLSFTIGQSLLKLMSTESIHDF